MAMGYLLLFTGSFRCEPWNAAVCAGMAAKCRLGKPFGDESRVSASVCIDLGLANVTRVENCVGVNTL